MTSNIDVLPDLHLLNPVDDAEPCGPDLEYDPAFVLLQAALTPKTEAQYGDFVETAQPVNWIEVERDCRALLLRTKDIRLFVIFLRCRIKLAGSAGLRDALGLLLAAMERHGEALHPVPMFDGERDPVVYANALSAIADSQGALGDIRDLALAKVAGAQLQLRDIEKSHSLPRAKDALTPEAARRLLDDLCNSGDRSALALVQVQHYAEEIAALTRSLLGENAPDLDGLLKLLRPFSMEARNTPMLEAEPPRTDESFIVATAPATIANDAPPLPGDTITAPGGAPRNDGALRDRWSALANIRQTRLWFEQHEPSSPVAVLLRQAERMVGKRFAEIAHQIPADLLTLWDRPEES